MKKVSLLFNILIIIYQLLHQSKKNKNKQRELTKKHQPMTMKPKLFLR